MKFLIRFIMLLGGCFVFYQILSGMGCADPTAPHNQFDICFDGPHPHVFFVIFGIAAVGTGIILAELERSK